jgi:hypothetical protein
MNNFFSNFPSTSRIWLYQTDRAMTDSEMKEVNAQLTPFIAKWAAHGNKLWADAMVLNPFFVAFVVDNEQTVPSGCSIDSSVHFMRDLGKQVRIDFFNRMKITVMVNEELQQLNFQDLAKAHQQQEELLLFDPLADSLGTLRHSWPCKVEESSLSSLVSL